MSDAQTRPAGWKNYEDFAAGIATNRLRPSDALVGTTLEIELPGRSITLSMRGRHEVAWRDTMHGAGTDWCEAIEVAPDTWFIDATFAQRPLAATTFIVNARTRRVLAIESLVRSREEAGAEPRVAQDFIVGVLAGGPATGEVPHATRDLIGLRTWQTYSPHHVYEHTYLSAQRYAWQCLVGVQRGHGDVDMASYYRFAENQYVFTFREFLIPVASVFFFDFQSTRSTGKFLGLTAIGEVSNSPAGAFIRKASVTTYQPGEEPA